jgi:DNA-binding transcriptional LysR family regulator
MQFMLSFSKRGDLMLDVHQLNVFLVAAEALSFTQAAKRLHMTQPSVSQHIQSLESLFGTQLFIRSGRNLILTDGGLALVPLAREAVALSHRIEETMESLQGQIHGHLIVGCSTTPGKYILPQILAKFHKLYPFVRATCLVATQTEVVKKVIAGEAHFFLFSIPAEGNPDLEIRHFMCDPVVLIAPLDHPWAKKNEIQPTDLLEGNFIMPEATSGTYLAVEEALAEHDISMQDLDIPITLGNAEAIALAVQEGLGVGFISKMVVDRFCAAKVTVIQVHGMDICRNIYFSRSNRRPPTAAQTAFWDFLIKGKHLFVDPLDNLNKPVLIEG